MTSRQVPSFRDTSLKYFSICAHIFSREILIREGDKNRVGPISSLSHTSLHAAQHTADQLNFSKKLQIILISPFMESTVSIILEIDSSHRY